MTGNKNVNGRVKKGPHCEERSNLVPGRALSNEIASSMKIDFAITETKKVNGRVKNGRHCEERSNLFPGNALSNEIASSMKNRFRNNGK